MVDELKVLEAQSAINTALAALAKEQIIAATREIDRYNHLEVYNRNPNAIQINLDNDDKNNNIKVITGSTIAIFSLEDNMNFKKFEQINLSATDVQVAGSILFIAKKVLKIN